MLQQKREPSIDTRRTLGVPNVGDLRRVFDFKPAQLA
jgi:hypothetical protein